MNSITVVKIGGAKGNETQGLIDDIRELRLQNIPVILVHGGSSETTELAERLGIPSRFLTSPSGQVSRRTDRRTLEVFAQATALLNRRLVEDLRTKGVDAFGVSGLDGGLIRGRRKPVVRSVEGSRTVLVRDEWTGRPLALRTELMSGLLEQGLTLVVAPILCGENGEMLNVDGDRLAAFVASQLNAESLVFLTNVPGLLRDASDSSSLVERISDFEVAEQYAQGRMKKKIMGARIALEGGVDQIVIADSRSSSPLLEAMNGKGTTFVLPAGQGREMAS